MGRVSVFRAVTVAALLMTGALMTSLWSIAPAQAAGGVELPEQKWSFAPPFGTYDRGSAQRGYQVYSEVCAACHSLSLVAYRNLADIGFTENEVKAIAAEAEVIDGPNAEGEMFDRPGRPADRFVAPFANDNEARSANGGAMPPDLSLMTKARVNGPDYLHALMTGYVDAPADVKLMDGMHFNTYFSGNQIAMPAPLSDDGIEYADGTKASIDQQARDVTIFLMWAAEPNLEERHRMGAMVILFLVVMTGLLYASKRKIWANVH